MVFGCTESEVLQSLDQMRRCWALLVLISVGQVSLPQERVLFCTGNAELFDLDVASCEAILIGSTSTNLQDIAFTPDGRLWGCYLGQLYNIDSQNASTTPIGVQTQVHSPALVAFDNDTLLGVYNEWLWGIRVSDGGVWQIAEIGYNALGDLTWYESNLYLTAVGGVLVRMEVEADLTGVSNVQNIGLLNDGIGTWFGTNTVVFEQCEPRLGLISFSSTSIYEVSAIDASATILCESIVGSDVWGATSFGEVRSVFTSSVFEWPNVITPNGDGVNEQFRPLNNLLDGSWSLIVFNRWGQVVHDSGQRSIGWDGRNPAGVECSEGIYYYIASVRNECEQPRMLNGFVTLLR